MKKLLAGLLAATMAVGMSVSAFAAMVDYIEVEPKEPFTVSGTSVNYELGTSYGDVYADTWTTRAVDYLESTIDVNTDAMGGTDGTSDENTNSVTAFVDGFEYDTAWDGWCAVLTEHIAIVNGRSGMETDEFFHNWP